MNVVQCAMKLCLIGSVLVVPASDAQQRIPERPQIPPVPVEQAMERRAEQALRQLERLERQLPQAAQRAEARMQANVADAVQRRAGIPQRLPATAQLPDQLDIVAAGGALRHREIQIEPFIRVVQREWVLLASDSDLDELHRQNSELLEYLHGSRELSTLNRHVLTFRVPDSLDNQRNIERLLPQHLHELLDRQHVYQLHSAPAVDDLYQLPLPSVCQNELRIGVIDTHLQSEHQGFATARQQQRLVEYSPMEGYDRLPTGHGTAVTGLFIGEHQQLAPLLPGSTVYQVGAFYQQRAGHQGSKVEYLLAGIDWLLSQDVAVINMSLAGPANNLLKQAVDLAAASNVAVVAAVGNLGPHAPAQYPAAYPSVIAVTAIDQQGQVYPWAGRGGHVDFAAPGVNIPVLQAGGGIFLSSGTSMAAPVVSALAGCHRQDTTEHTKSYLQNLSIQPQGDADALTLGYGVLRP